MNHFNRLKFLRIAACGGFLAGIFGSYELWFPVERNFPRAPLFFDLPENSVVFLERFFSVFLIASLNSIIVFRRQKIFLIAAAALLVLLILFDQTRLQPWVYQYFLLLLVMAQQTNDEITSDQTLVLAQVLIAALYFWSGVQKLNYTFSHETLPLLLAPLENLFPTAQLPLVLIGLTIALIEASIGIGLLFRRTRNTAVCLAVGMHAAILALLIAKDYNRIVWIWNAALIALVLIAFWRSDTSVKQAIQTSDNLKVKAAKTLVAASVLLPALSFFGLWDMYLSGALYSGNSQVAVVRINENLFEKLPPKARAAVFQIKNGGEKMLPLVEWAIAEMNVPVYPEKRIFRQIAREVCKLADDKDRTELIIKERPAILDGSYKVTRISCAELEKAFQH